MHAEVWPGVCITVRRKLPRSIRFPSSSQISISIGTGGSLNILRSIEKSSRSMILLAARRGAAMIGGADGVEMFVAENQHVDLVGRAVDMMEAFQQGRIVGRQPDIDHDGPL